MEQNTKQNTKEKKKGGVTGKGFDVLGQPSPEAKSAGWDRKRRAREIMELSDKYSKMTYEELKRISIDREQNPSQYTVDEVRMIEYMIKSLKKDAMLIDFLDRHIGKAPPLIGEGEGIAVEGWRFEIIDKTQDVKDDTDN